MRSLCCIILIALVGCSDAHKPYSSYWEKLEGDFKYRNRTEFISDSVLRTDCAHLVQSNHPLFNRITSPPVYLYSWQERDQTKNEFAVIKDDGELGLRIFYFILDKNDSLISSTQVAGKGCEAGYWFETWTRATSKDTMLHFAAVTQWYDLDKHQQMLKPKGDTTFSWLLTDKNGKLTETVYKEVEHLHYENEQVLEH